MAGSRVKYWRLHGSPRMYYSCYDENALRRIADRLVANDARVRERWCIFDNTAHGHATANALRLAKLVQQRAARSGAR
jgi:uncharacterized protein YecE (DUF72 family)